MTQEEYDKVRESIKGIDWNNDDDNVSESIFEEILEDAHEVNGVRIADYLLKNGEFTRPQKGLSEDEVVGIVAGFHNETPIIASLKFFTGIFDRKYNSTFGKSYHISKEAKKAFDGQIITRKYKEGKREDRFEAFEACLNYRKNKNEEWYLGAAGEVATMLNNWVYLNAAHRITKLGTIINHGDCYTTCSENGLCGSWYCQLMRPIDPDIFWYDKGKGNHKLGDCIVVPLLVYKKKSQDLQCEFNFNNKKLFINNMPTREEVKELLPILQAYAKGKTIQCRESINDEWEDIIEPSFDELASEYRIKPEPRYRAFKSQEECWNEMLNHQPFGWFRSKCNKNLFNIICIDDDGIKITSTLIKSKETYYNAFSSLEFADGTPFGIKEE